MHTTSNPLKPSILLLHLLANPFLFKTARSFTATFKRRFSYHHTSYQKIGFHKDNLNSLQSLSNCKCVSTFHQLQPFSSCESTQTYIQANSPHYQAAIPLFTLPFQKVREKPLSTEFSQSRKMSTRRTTRSSTALKNAASESSDNLETDSSSQNLGPKITGKLSPLKSKGSKRKTAKKNTAETKKTSSPKKKATKRKSAEKENTDETPIPSTKKASPSKAKKKAKKPKIEPQRLTEKEPLEKLWDAKKAMEEKGSYSKEMIIFT